MRHFKNAAVLGWGTWKNTHFTYLSIYRENAQKLKKRAESDSSSSLAVQFVWLKTAANLFPSISQTTRSSCTFCNNCLYLGGRGRIGVRHQWKTAKRGNPTNCFLFKSWVRDYRGRNKHQLGYLNQKHTINLVMGWCSQKRKFLLKLPENNNRKKKKTGHFFILSITFANIQVIS